MKRWNSLTRTCKLKKTSHTICCVKHHISEFCFFLFYSQALSVIFINMKKKTCSPYMLTFRLIAVEGFLVVFFSSSSLNNSRSSTCRYICYSTLFSKSKWTCFMTSITLMCIHYVVPTGDKIFCVIVLK